MIKNIAVILAAGSGSRSDFSQPKQLVKLCGRPVIDHTLDRFEDNAEIGEIAIVTSAGCIREIESLVSRRQAGKVKKILLGGKERYESSIAAINAYEREAGSSQIRLIFHDAVRPLVSDRIISDVVAALDHYRAVDVTIPATDTVVVASAETDTMRDIPDRRFMHLGQTPQAFAYETIKKAYQLALQDSAFRTTDDCGVVLKYLPDEKIYLVRGALNNIKLTFADDLLVLDKFMQSNSARRLDAVSDTSILGSLRDKSLVVFGGSSGIGESIARIAQGFGAVVHVASRSNDVDISDACSVERFYKKVVETSGRIDAVINTAAVLNRQPMMSMSTEEVLESVNTNYVGAITVARLGYRYLRLTRGHLVFFTSSSYTYGRAFYAVYSSSKAAVVNLTQALADEWEESGVRVNCISPERTRTPMRIKAFGFEPPDALLDPDVVARKSLGVLVGSSTGFIYDISRK